MPALDFTEVLTAVEFTDTISVLSVTNTITSGGVSAPASSTTTVTTAVVVPGDASLRRLDDGTRVTANIDVYSRFPLSTGGSVAGNAAERVADVVTWHGRQYVVAAVEDYSTFGAGFFHASCDLIQLNPAA